MPQYIFLAAGVLGCIVRQAYIVAMEYLAAQEPPKVGIYMELDHCDYPVSALFREIAGDAPRLGHIGVTNVSGFCNISWVIMPILSGRLLRWAAMMQLGFGITARLALGKTGARRAGCTRTLLAQNQMLVAVNAIWAILMRLLIDGSTDTLRRIGQRFRPPVAGLVFDFLY